MKSIFKFSVVLLTVILVIVENSSASFINPNNSITLVSEPFSLIIIGVILISVGCFLRKMKSDIA